MSRQTDNVISLRVDPTVVAIDQDPATRFNAAIRDAWIFMRNHELIGGRAPSLLVILALPAGVASGLFWILDGLTRDTLAPALSAGVVTVFVLLVAASIFMVQCLRFYRRPLAQRKLEEQAAHRHRQKKGEQTLFDHRKGGRDA